MSDIFRTPSTAAALIDCLRPSWAPELTALKSQRIEELYTTDRRHSRTLELFRATYARRGFVRGVQAVVEYKMMKHRLKRAEARDVLANGTPREWREHARGIQDDSSNKIYVGVQVTGGVGDLVCVGRWLHRLQQAFPDELVVDLFFGKGRALEFLARDIGAAHFFPVLALKELHDKYPVFLKLNQFVAVEIASEQKERVQRLSPALYDLLAKISAEDVELRGFIRQHPHLDGAYAEWEKVRARFRANAFFAICGWPNEPYDYLAEKVGCSSLNKLGLLRGHYITVHDGWDANFKIQDGRPTKSYPPAYWENLVRRLRQAYPDYPVVQLGGPDTGQDIAGVTINLKGKLPFEVSAEVLAGAVLHVDAESGLVHLATALGTHCAVIFGPTSVDYYGYPSNLNIAPRRCGNCMWVTDHWMEQCPRELSHAECIDSLDPDYVFAKIDAYAGVNLRNSGVLEREDQ